MNISFAFEQLCNDIVKFHGNILSSCSMCTSGEDGIVVQPLLEQGSQVKDTTD